MTSLVESADQLLNKKFLLGGVEYRITAVSGYGSQYFPNLSLLRFDGVVSFDWKYSGWIQLRVVDNSGFSSIIHGRPPATAPTAQLRICETSPWVDYIQIELEIVVDGRTYVAVNWDEPGCLFVAGGSPPGHLEGCCRSLQCAVCELYLNNGQYSCLCDDPSLHG